MKYLFLIVCLLPNFVLANSTIGIDEVTQQVKTTVLHNAEIRIEKEKLLKTIVRFIKKGNPLLSSRNMYKVTGIFKLELSGETSLGKIKETSRLELPESFIHLNRNECYMELQELSNTSFAFHVYYKEIPHKNLEKATTCIGQILDDNSSPEVKYLSFYGDVIVEKIVPVNSSKLKML